MSSKDADYVIVSTPTNYDEKTNCFDTSMVEDAIAAGIDTLIFVTGKISARLRITLMQIMNWKPCYVSREKDAQANMVRNITPQGVECIFVRQAEQFGLGHAVLCAERAVGGDPFAVLLADDFLTDYKPGVTTDLAQAFKTSGKSQLSAMEVDGLISQNTVLWCLMGLVRVLWVG